MIFSIYTITLDGTLVILLELMNMLTTQRLADYNTRRAADQVFSMGMEVGAAKHIAAPISCLYATPRLRPRRGLQATTFVNIRWAVCSAEAYRYICDDRNLAKNAPDRIVKVVDD
jgi:hypothetical protein